MVMATLLLPNFREQNSLDYYSLYNAGSVQQGVNSDEEIIGLCLKESGNMRYSLVVSTTDTVLCGNYSWDPL